MKLTSVLLALVSVWAVAAQDGGDTTQLTSVLDPAFGIKKAVEQAILGKFGRVTPSSTPATPPTTVPPLTSALPVTTLVPPTSCAVCPICPVLGSTTATLTTLAPATTAAPAVTTIGPVSTLAPTTTLSPATTVGPATTLAPVTTVAPITTVAPVTTLTPVTTITPATTITPDTPVIVLNLYPISNVPNAPAVWGPDRYVPSGFYKATTVSPITQNDVLQVYISSADALGVRPANTQVNFYNTQGRTYLTPYTAPSPSSFYVTADLWIPNLWSITTTADASLNRRAELWTLISNNNDPNTGAFPILGFTNEYPARDTQPAPNKLTSGGTPRFRIYDATGILPNNAVNDFFDLPNTVLYDKWNKLAIQFTVAPLLPGSSVVTVTYFINGEQSAVSTDLGIFTDVTFNQIFVQSYNYALVDHTDINTQNDYNYDIFWRNFHVNKGQYSALTAATLAARIQPDIKSIRAYGNYSHPD